VEKYKGYNLAPLDENAPLLSGDRILIRFKWLGASTTSRAMQLAAIERDLERRADWRIVSYTDLADFLDAEIEIISVPKIDPGSGITQASLGAATAVVLTAALIAASIVTYHLSKVYQWKLISEGKLPPESYSRFQEIASGLHVAVYIGVAIGLIWILKQISLKTGSPQSHQNGY